MSIKRIGGSILIWSIVLFAPTLSAQSAGPRVSTSGVTPEVVTLTLEEAVRRAVDNNPDLAIVRLGTDVEASRVLQADGAYRPVFATTFGRSSITTAPLGLDPTSQGIETSEWFSSAGVTQRLRRGGGTWAAAFDASRTGSNNPFNAFDPNIQSGLQAAFSQPLFRNRKIDAARVQYKIAQRNHQSSDLRFRQSVVQTVAEVKHAYWTLKAAIANVTVHRESLRLAEDLVRENRVRVDVGQAPPLDVVQAEAEVASRRENLIRAEATAGDAEDQLRRLIMSPTDTAFWRTSLDPIDEPEASTSAIDVDAAIETALKTRYDIALARNDWQNADTNVEFMDNQKLPDVRLEASYRSTGIGGTQLLRTGPFPGTVTGSLRSGVDDVLGQMFTSDYPAWSVGVTVSYPIGRSYEEAGLARAEIERRQAALRIESLQLQAAETIRRSGRQVTSTAERIDAARAGERLAQQRLDVERKRFEAGLSTTFLVTQAQRDLIQSQVNLLQAMLDHQNARVDFEAVQIAAPQGSGGDIGLERANVVLLPPSTPAGIFRR
jgi:outer membrane protein TolC